MADIKAGFFAFGITLDEHRKCVVRSEEGEAHIVLGLSEDKPVKFTYKLWLSTDDNDVMEKISEQKMDRFAFFTQKDSQLHAQVTLPFVGKYKLDISAEASGWTDSDYDVGDGDSFTLLEFLILCDEAKVDCVPLPENSRQEWGPGRAMEQAGIVPSTHTQPVIHVSMYTRGLYPLLTHSLLYMYVCTHGECTLHSDTICYICTCVHAWGVHPTHTQPVIYVSVYTRGAYPPLKHSLLYMEVCTGGECTLYSYTACYKCKYVHMRSVPSTHTQPVIHVSMYTQGLHPPLIHSLLYM